MKRFIFSSDALGVLLGLFLVCSSAFASPAELARGQVYSRAPSNPVGQAGLLELEIRGEAAAAIFADLASSGHVKGSVARLGGAMSRIRCESAASCQALVLVPSIVLVAPASLTGINNFYYDSEKHRGVFSPLGSAEGETAEIELGTAQSSEGVLREAMGAVNGARKWVGNSVRWECGLKSCRLVLAELLR